jgi:S-adenosylmethionine:tRNA ribosyltransferase-isomerase
MKTDLFDYRYPRSLIATQPCRPRDQSKLLVMHREKKRFEHRQFKDVMEYLKTGDCIVLNDTQVMPVRLEGKKKETGGRVGLLLSKERSSGVWEALIRPGRIKTGTIVELGTAPFNITVLDRMNGEGSWQVKLSRPLRKQLFQKGQAPLPPYMKRLPKAKDKEWYQTVYAQHPGSIAAPTAGLHFTQSLIQRLKRKGILFASVTCHIGYATFRSVSSSDVNQHVMHAETYSVSRTHLQTIRKTKQQGGRVVAVGTSSTRVLETLGSKILKGPLRHWKGDTQLFIKPPFRFKVVDALITNFHMPRTTLILLVSAFAGREGILEAYRKAIRARYRLFSYGDAMLIL